MSHESVTIKRDNRAKHVRKVWQDLAVGEPFTKVGSDILCGKVDPISYVRFGDVALVKISVSNPEFRVCPCVMTITWNHKFATS